jgi:two-component system, OmpR family, phosphate regulon sensor histidine kinase PhoR
MKQLFGLRAVIALLLVGVSSAAGLLLGAHVDSVLIALVGGAAAVLMAAGTRGDEEEAAPPPAPPPSARTADEPRIADAIEAIGEPVLIVGDNRVLAANAPARTLLGGHVIGEDVRLAIRHPAAAERLITALDGQDDISVHLVGLGTRDQRWEMRMRALPGGRRIVHLSDKTGAHATDKIRIDFVANASHELRTPLASLLGFIETLGDEAGDDPETRARFLKVMHDEAVRMQRLVDDLMSLSRIEAEKYREPDQAVDLGAMIAALATEYASTQGARGGEVVTRLDPLAPVKGDYPRLSQLLHNIVGNALKYGRPGTPVTIRLSRDGQMARLSVSDEGEGIAPEHLPRLTERFYRVDSGRSRALGGTGLGLSIVKHIVERHRGRMDIHSIPGKGTTVTVLLPLDPTAR